MWKRRRHLWWAAELLTENSPECNSRGYSCIDRKSSNFGIIRQETRGRQRRSSCHADSRTSGLRQFLGKWHHYHKGSTNWLHLSKVCSGLITCVRPIALYLSHYPTLAGHLWERGFVWYNATAILLAAHGKWCLQKFTWMSLVCQERTLRDLQA